MFTSMSRFRNHDQDEDDDDVYDDEVHVDANISIVLLRSVVPVAMVMMVCCGSFLQAVEQMDSEEILDQVRFRSNRTQASPWSDGLVLLGRPQTHTDSHEDTGDDSDQDQHRTLLLSLHHLFSRSRHQAVGGASAQEGGVLTHGGAMSAAAVGGAEPDFDQGSEEGLTSDLQHYSHHHGYDTEEAGLVLGL
ncbi:uncharacterized protein LOC115415934 isoform X2 [Sphaeramia orbicularis]|uniref:uncharacterized protein LOC115415934 isoform X2 n=1 Tax=Sphaeramia orbicularis TaxID=375764 RepID=UPI001180F8EB|nr:uncharacterized protein LOC115415934 isoform X2 [Sphaeramia orbicularis]